MEASRKLKWLPLEAAWNDDTTRSMLQDARSTTTKKKVDDIAKLQCEANLKY